MSEVASAFVTLVPTFRGGRSAIDRELGGPLDESGREGGKRFGKGMSAGIGGMATKIFAPLAAAAGGLALGGFFKGAIDAASDLGETVAAVDVIFGEGSEAVKAFAGDSKRNILLTKQEALSASQVFGTFGKSAGLAGTDLSKFSTDFVGLASDLASFNNTSPEEAVQAIGSALRGEAEPLRAYGVLLDDATLRQEALSLGLIKTTKEALTPQQKVLAAQAAIYKQTTDAQGDALRTSGSYANQTRMLGKQFEDLKVRLGSALLPVVLSVTKAFGSFLGGLGGSGNYIGGMAEKLAVLGLGLRALVLAFKDGDVTSNGFVGAMERVGVAARSAFAYFTAEVLPRLREFGAFLTGTVLPALLSLGQFIGRNTDFFIPFAGAIVAIVAALRVWAVVQGILNAVLLANPIGLVIVAIAALVAGLVMAYNRSETFRKIVQAAFFAVQMAMLKLRETFADGIAYIVEVFNGGGGRVGSIIRAVVALVQSQLNTMLNIARGVINLVVGIFTGDFGKIKSAVGQILGGVVSLLSALPRQILGALGSLGSLLFDKGQEIVQGLINGIKAMAGRLAATVKNAVADTIGKFIPGSPVREGPLRVLNRGHAGKLIASMLADGIISGAADVRLAASALGSSAVPVAPTGVLGAGISGGNLTAVGGPGGPVRWHPDDLATLIDGFHGGVGSSEYRTMLAVRQGRR